jgi:hypothetical protein
MLVKWFAKYKVDIKESDDDTGLDRAPSFVGDQGFDDVVCDHEFDGHVADRHKQLLNHKDFD